MNEEQRDYIAENPHDQHIRHAFATARIEYGRIHHAVSDGRLRVFEINTNPAIGHSLDRTGDARVGSHSRRQPDLDTEPTGRGVTERDRSAVEMDQIPDDREAQAGSRA